VSAFQSKFPGAFETGKMIFDLAQGCYAYETVIQLARDPRSATIVPDSALGDRVLVATLDRKDGSKHRYDVSHHLKLSKDHAFIAPQIQRSWYVGALVTAGDVLEKYQYFDHGPELELIYHLRNGVAHGNAFNLTKAGKSRLKRYPAYNRPLRRREEVFHIVPTLGGQPVLFDFMAAADVVDLLITAAERLKDLERGILGPGVYTSVFG